MKHRLETKYPWYDQNWFFSKNEIRGITHQITFFNISISYSFDLMNCTFNNFFKYKQTGEGIWVMNRIRMNNYCLTFQLTLTMFFMKNAMIFSQNDLLKLMVSGNPQFWELCWKNEEFITKVLKMKTLSGNRILLHSYFFQNEKSHQIQKSPFD
jgi:hypothetical protein